MFDPCDSDNEKRKEKDKIKGEKKRLTPKALNLGLSGVGAPPEPKLKAPLVRPPQLS